MRLILTAALLLLACGAALADDLKTPDDPFLWLEPFESPRALAWVNAENARSAAVLE
jgi:prolyl oligopeptidase